MARKYKGNVIVRYLVSRTGIAGIQWSSELQDISSPAPYTFKATTNVKDDILWSRVKNLPRGGISAVIRYDKWIESVDDSIVSMRLSDFVKLLTAYEEVNQHTRRGNE